MSITASATGGGAADAPIGPGASSAGCLVVAVTFATVSATTDGSATSKLSPAICTGRSALASRIGRGGGAGLNAACGTGAGAASTAVSSSASTSTSGSASAVDSATTFGRGSASAVDSATTFGRGAPSAVDSATSVDRGAASASCCCSPPGTPWLVAASTAAKVDSAAAAIDSGAAVPLASVTGNRIAGTGQVLTITCRPRPATAAGSVHCPALVASQPGFRTHASVAFP